MRRVLTGLALAALVVVGCNKSEPGGPGATKKETGAGAILGKGNAQTFAISAPIGAKNVKQGGAETFEFKVDRGTDFKENVKLSFDAPKGIKIEPNPVEVKASDTEKVSVKVMAEKDAPLGEHTVTVKGTPAKGDPTSVTFKVEVVKGDGK